MNCTSVCCCCEAIINPSVYAEKHVQDGWDWDSDTKVKAQGFLHVLKSAQHIIAFLVAKNGLEQVKHIAAKLQKGDQDIVHAYDMIDSTIDNANELRKNIKDEFHDWFVDATRIANEIGSEISLPRIKEDKFTMLMHWLMVQQLRIIFVLMWLYLLLIIWNNSC